jgi:NAD(P)-dependent dehydrogenase (short-subunit alcohol dehydrogenase family)
VVVNDLGGTPEGSGADPEPASSVVAEIVDAGGKAIADTRDVSDVVGADALIATAVEEFGGVDILVNNAGNMIWGGPPDLDAQAIRKILDVHIMGSCNTIRAAWPHMAGRDYGRIVLTSSTGIFGLPDNLGYAIAKAGMLGMAKSLTVAAGAAGKDIKINVIAPNASTRLGAHPSGGLDELRASQPVQLNMGTELVAPMVAFLAHEDCPVSGEAYVAGAGRFGRMWIAGNYGFLHTQPEKASIEDVAENWSAINDEAGYYVPSDIMDWAGHFMGHLA